MGGTMCEDLNLKWVDSFTVLGITIDNRLKYLQDNCQTIYEKVDKKIGTWIRYGLTFQGRITVAKTLLLSQYTYIATILDSNNKKLTDKIQTQINLFVYQNKVGVKNHQNPKNWVPEDIYHGGKPIGGFRMIKISDFFQSLRLAWVRRYTYGNGTPLNYHWCDILDKILGVSPQERILILNRGSEFLTKKVHKYYPCLTEFLISLQELQKKWLTLPTTGDNRWEFQPVFYNPNINFKQFSRGKKYIIPEDFRFTPDNDILSLRFTDICNEGKLSTDVVKLKRAFGFENWAKPFAVNQLIGCLNKLPNINKTKFPSLPLQKPPLDMYFFEEVSDLFFISKKGGQNYRKALNPEKVGQKIKIDTEKSRFGCDNNDTEIVLNARKALHWKELSNETRDANIRLYYGKTMFAAQVSNFAVADRSCSRCKVEDGVTIDETFKHGCYDCPHVKKHFRRVTRIFGFSNTNHLTAKDTFVWKRFFNIHTYAELSKSKKYGNQPTIFNLVSTICGEILKTVKLFKNSKLGYALSKQDVTEELLKSGFTPWVQPKIAIYNAIDNF